MSLMDKLHFHIFLFQFHKCFQAIFIILEFEFVFIDWFIVCNAR